MATVRRWLSGHPFLGAFVGALLLWGVAIALGTSPIFTLFMAMLGFLLGAALVLKLGEKKPDLEAIDAAIRDGRGKTAEIASQVPYDLRNFPTM